MIGHDFHSLLGREMQDGAVFREAVHEQGVHVPIAGETLEAQASQPLSGTRLVALLNNDVTEAKVVGRSDCHRPAYWSHFVLCRSVTIAS